MKKHTPYNLNAVTIDNHANKIKQQQKKFHQNKSKLMKNKLRPCDCNDMSDAIKLKEQGIWFNDQGIYVEPNLVVITMGHTTLRIPMSRFKMFAEWYFEAQDISSSKTSKTSKQ